MATPILVTGAAGRVGGIRRTVTELLLKQGKAVRAMVRNEDDRVQVLRDMGAEVAVGDLLDGDCRRMAPTGTQQWYVQGQEVAITRTAQRSEQLLLL
jgi:nucleoside-diphosphate-sugar epimerase